MTVQSDLMQSPKGKQGYKVIGPIFSPLRLMKLALRLQAMRRPIMARCVVPFPVTDISFTTFEGIFVLYAVEIQCFVILSNLVGRTNHGGGYHLMHTKDAFCRLHASVLERTLA